MALGAWRLALGAWRLALGAWRLALGAWRLALGAAQLHAPPLSHKHMPYACLHVTGLRRIDDDFLGRSALALCYASSGAERQPLD